MGEAGNIKHTHTHSVTRDTQDGWSLGQGPDVILTNVGVAPHLLNYWAMNIERTHWGVGGESNVKHTHTHSVPRDTQDR